MKKHFETFKGVNACDKNKKDNMTTDWEKVKCGRCKNNDEFKQARQRWKENNHPNFHKSLADKIDMKLEVTPDESTRVQEICFSNGVEWVGSGSIYCKNRPRIYIDIKNGIDEYMLSYNSKKSSFKERKSKLFSFENDCFVSDIKQELSACGRNIEEFLESVVLDEVNISCNIYCEVDGYNMFYFYPNESKEEFFIKLKSKIKTYGLKNYRIKEPQNISACGKTLDEFMEACNNDLLNVETDIFGEWTKTMNYKKSQINNCKLGHYRIKEPSNVEVINKNIKDNRPICPYCYTPEGEEHQSFCTYESDIKKQKSYAVDASDEYRFENGYTFKPKQYTITEDQMNDICGIIQDGINCNMEFSDDFNEMKENAFAIKDKALLYLENIINKIKGDLDEKF